MKKIYSLIMAFFVSLTMYAGEVTEQQALQQAQQFMQGKKFKQTNLHRAASAAGNAYYVFNAEDNGGFVIVAGDDRVKDILGYSERGSFDLSKAPSNVRWWLSQYEKAISSLGKETHEAISHRAEIVKEEIVPFITTTWGQNYPYNSQCPEINGEYCATGCVATAMAQVINYTKWPESSTGEISSYTTKTNQIEVPKLEATTFNWSNITDTDIARLMRYCGQAVGMDYNIVESGAYDVRIPVAMIGKFGYDRNIHIEYRSGYKNSEWENIIYNELKAGHPVIYGGQSDNGGHSFICHGYRDNMFYINWGWDGQYDGYFALTALNPYGNEAYVRDQIAIIGIRKPVGGEDMLPNSSVTITQFNYISANTVKRNSLTEDFKEIRIEYSFAHSFPENTSIQIGCAIYQGMEKKSIIDWGTIDLSPGHAVSINTSVSFGNGLSDGIYRIVPVYCIIGTNDWIDAKGSDWRYIEVAIDGLTLQIMPYAAQDDRLIFEPVNEEFAKVRAANKDIEGDIVIPEYVTINAKSYKVIAIDHRGFQGCNKVTSIKMPSFLESWLNYSFADCSQLKSLIIPKSLKFYSSCGLGWTMEHCIAGCDNLSEIIVEEGNTDFCVENGALMNKNKTVIYGYLGGLKNKEYTMPSTIKSMAEGTFANNKYLEIVNLSPNINHIPSDAFFCCKSLKTVHMSDNVLEISEQAFIDCAIEEIKLSSNLQEIERAAFAYCRNLKEIELPQSLRKMDLVFGGCNNLETITIRKEALFVESNQFDDEVYERATLYVPQGCSNFYKNATVWKKFKNIVEKNMPDVVISGNPFYHIEDNQMLFGYYRTEDYSYAGLGGGSSGKYKACIGFSKDCLQPFRGATIKYFRFVLMNTNIYDVKFWIGSSRDKQDLCLQSITNIETGWNVVRIDNPPMITGDSIFMGIEYNADAGSYPIGYIDSPLITGNYRTSEPGCAFIYGPYGDNNSNDWIDEHSSYCLSMQCILESDNLPSYDIHVSGIQLQGDDIYYYKADGTEELGFAIYLKNWGKAVVDKDFQLEAEIDDKPTDYNKLTYNGQNVSGGYAYAQLIRMPIPQNLPVGLHKVKIYVDKIKGETPQYPQDDSVTYFFRVYKESVKRQKMLIENHTATWYRDAMGPNNTQNVLLMENSDLVPVTFHYNDELSSEASNEYFKKGHLSLGIDVNRFYGATSKNLEYIRNTMPSFVDIHISTYIDKENNILKVNIEGNCNDDMLIIHPCALLTVYLTEDNLIVPQYNGMTKTYIDNYVHNGVLRASLSNLWGDPIKWDGNHYKMTYTTKIDDAWNTENMHVVAFIEDDLEGETSGKPVINCNDFDVKNAEMVSFLLEPIDHTKEMTFSKQMNETTDLSNIIIDNTYFNMNAMNGDGYDATEQALVLNSTTSSAQMHTVQSAQVGDAAVKENFCGVIFEISAGQGTITVDAKTIGSHVLNVQVGNGTPTKVAKSERGTVDVTYDVAAATYAYLYASTADGSAAPLHRATTVDANSVVLYGYKVTIGSGTGINAVTIDKPVDVYTLQGQKVRLGIISLSGLAKGVYIINGRKVVVK